MSRSALEHARLYHHVMDYRSCQICHGLIGGYACELRRQIDILEKYAYAGLEQDIADFKARLADAHTIMALLEARMDSLKMAEDFNSVINITGDME